MIHIRKLFAVTVACALIPTIARAEPPDYILTDLGALPENFIAFTGKGLDLNSKGYIAGAENSVESTAQIGIPGNGVIDTNATLGGIWSTATAINENDHLTGNSSTATGASLAFYWDGTTMENLGTLGGNSSDGLAINNAGQITGGSETATGIEHAFFWDGDTMHDIGDLYGHGNNGRSISSNGLITGIVRLADSLFHAFIWDGSEMHDCETLGGDNSSGNAVNADGVVAGWSETADGDDIAMICADGTMTSLGTLDGDTWSNAKSINSDRTVVGWSSDSERERLRAFVWADGAIKPLPSPYRAEAWFINDSAAIFGIVYPGSGMRERIVKWDPISTIAIDIKPTSARNNVNTRSKGKIPVAVLTTDTFDATQVDVSTVAFGPAGATEAHARAHVKDVDDDGDMDMLLHFNTQETGIACGDTEATLTGMTFDGRAITGTDSVNPLRCPKEDVGHIWRVNYTQPALNSMNGKVETHILATDSSFASSGADYWNEVLPVPATQTLMETSVAGGGAPSITFAGQATSTTVTGTPMSGEPIDDDLDDNAVRFSVNVVDWELRDLNPVASYDLVFYDLDSLTASITLTTEVDSDGDGVLDQTDTIAWDIGDDFSLFQGVQPNAAGVIRGRWTGSSSSFVDVAGFQVAESVN